MKIQRRYTFKLYPTKKQESALLNIKGACQRLYNGMLQQRREGYKYRGLSITRSQQEKEITLLRKEDPEYKAIHSQVCQGVAKCLDEAFQHFFDRVSQGKTPGYPRFKAFQRYKGWEYKQYRKGWKLDLVPGKKGSEKGKSLTLHGVGKVRMRGSVRCQGGFPKTCTIIHKATGWYASVVFQYGNLEQLNRKSGTETRGLDWGVKSFLTGVNQDGEDFEVENPKPLQKKRGKLAQEQQKVALKKRGSKNRKKQVKKVAGVHAKIANDRKNFHHQVSTWLVKVCCLIAVEKLSVKNMTRNEGDNKKGLNRSILDTGPATFHNMLQYKAEEAGTEYVEIETRKWKPTQTCAECGSQEKKTLDERVHRCRKCGFECDRDLNAASVILSVALYGTATGFFESFSSQGPGELNACVA